ncbi:uncharacterized protein LOC111086299 [Limulus polyphemus]|uniref:Uncharacterized protein LOC111086299 n=1 Tax=Limulus polyphemus TaxID=6850 RepID=A0ABM1SL62_LIMPO|nr:uncharacterized protein LOC111086299 [Limulus polyphemus]
MADVESIFIVLILAAIFLILFAVIVWACCLFDAPKSSKADKRGREYSHPKPKLTAQQQTASKQQPEVEVIPKQEEITVQPGFLNSTIDRKMQQLVTEKKLSADRKRQYLESLIASVMSSINIAVSLAPYLTETVDTDSPLNNISVRHDNGKKLENPTKCGTLHPENVATEEQYDQTAPRDTCVNIETSQEQFL